MDGLIDRLMDWLIDLGMQVSTWKWVEATLWFGLWSTSRGI